MTAGPALRARLDTIQRRLLAIGVGGLAACLLASLWEPGQFFRSYLLGYLLWLGVALGSLAMLMLHHLVGGSWGTVIRGLLESSSRTLPMMALLFIPVLGGMRALYGWADPGTVSGDVLLEGKRAYLNIPFFVARAIGYFSIWILLALGLTKWSTDQERGGDSTAGRVQGLSAGGLVVYGLTVSFASIDWVMSLEAHWYSTIYGLLFVVGQPLTALAFTILVLVWFAAWPPLASVVSTSHYHDLGNLLLAFVMLWAYLGFSQYLIVWAGNLTDEIPWYLNRTRGGWQWVALFLVVFHFAVPFGLLLLRVIKRTAFALALVAGAVLVVRLVDLLWLVEPAFTHGVLQTHWLDVAAPIGIGGMWGALFVHQVKTRPLIASEPRIAMADGIISANRAER